MPDYTDAEIESLISCPKEISTPPSRSLRQKDGHLRNDAKMVATDGTKGTFTMFIRILEDFPEDFSIGLLYKPEDGRSEIMLLRCNGKHGLYNGKLGDPDHPHFDFHIHKANEKAMNAGKAPESFAEKTEAYASHEQALQHYVKVVRLNARNASKHFPSEVQSEIDFTQ